MSGCGACRPLDNYSLKNKLSQTKIGLFSGLWGQFSFAKADSYGNKKLIRKWTQSVFLFGTKNLVKPTLMGTKNFYENGPNPGEIQQ